MNKLPFEQWSAAAKFAHKELTLERIQGLPFWRSKHGILTLRVNSLQELTVGHLIKALDKRRQELCWSIQDIEESLEELEILEEQQ